MRRNLKHLVLSRPAAYAQTACEPNPKPRTVAPEKRASERRYSEAAYQVLSDMGGWSAILGFRV